MCGPSPNVTTSTSCSGTSANTCCKRSTDGHRHPGDQMETIIVGIDGSPGSRAALAWAFAEAGQRKARIVAL
ncbi:MAG: hypothetical protein F2876_11990, partial [Actinobacteria bacterium]|nr:hypothetical protein [Actinomycetota bacterium]